MTNTDKVREEIKDNLCSIVRDPHDELCEICNNDTNCYQMIYNHVNQILTIKELHVEAEDQTPPENPYPNALGRARIYSHDYDIYKRCQQDLLQDGWIKVERGN